MGTDGDGTSRETRSNVVPGIQAYRLPEMDGILARSNALSIILERVRRPENSPRPGRDMNVVSRVCERLEGM